MYTWLISVYKQMAGTKNMGPHGGHVEPCRYLMVAAVARAVSSCVLSCSGSKSSITWLRH